MLVAQDGLHRLNVACRCQHASSQGAPSTVRAAELDTGLAVEPADRLLERITGPVRRPNFSPERVKAGQRGEPCEIMSISHATNQSAARRCHS